MGKEVNKDAAIEALQNEVVLWEIFKYLPTSTLVSSCSLVNKHWNNQARSFIQSYRECTVKLGYEYNDGYYSGNLWKSLSGLDQVLGEMKVIPFNSLRMLIGEWTVKSDEEANMSSLKNLMTRFPLKFLSVYEDGDLESCSSPTASAVLELVRQNSGVLLELEIRSDAGNVGLFKGWQPPGKFKNLKKLSIGHFSSVEAECAKNIILGAPNLRGIHHNCLHLIHDDMIPHNMYGTLKRLSFHIGDVYLVEKFADKLDHLEEMTVIQEGRRIGRYVSDQRHVRLCERLLALNALTLCKLHVRCQARLLLSQLELPMLPCVKNVYLIDHNIPEYLVLINFPLTFPNLRQVRIEEQDDISDGDDDDVIPDQDVRVAPNASQTTLELTLNTNIHTQGLVTLRRLFPNVIKLSIEVDGFSDCQQLANILNFWPSLQSLRIEVCSFEEKQVGAQVLGLHPEELELLCHEEKEFLERLQIPPSRPCVATLKELENFEVEYSSREDPETGRTFLELMETLLIGRKPGLKFKVEPAGPDWSSWNIPRFGNFWEDVHYDALEDSDSYN